MKSKDITVFSEKAKKVCLSIFIEKMNKQAEKDLSSFEVAFDTIISMDENFKNGFANINSEQELDSWCNLVAKMIKTKTFEEIADYMIQLASLFGDKNEILKYLENFKESKQPFHDACLFKLPPDGWDKKIWRALLKKYPPTSANDWIMRILPFAVKIQEYVIQNKPIIALELENEINKKYEKIFIKEFLVEKEKYEKFDKELWIENEIQSMMKGIDKLANDTLTKEICVELGFIQDKNQSVELDVLKLKQIEELKKNKIVFYQERKESIKQDLIKDRKEKLTKEYNKTGQLIELGEQNYIETRMNDKDIKNKIAGELKNKKQDIFSEKMSLDTIKKYMKEVGVYQNAKQNPEAAELFFSYQIPEESFDLYLTLKPKDSDTIPNIKIDCTDIASSYKGFYIKKLPSSDPRCALLGKMTGCCQSLGFEGESCAINGIENKNAGFYVLCKQDKEKEVILSQCWAWRDNQGNLVFDSIETEFQFNQKLAGFTKVVVTSELAKQTEDLQANTILIHKEDNQLTAYWKMNGELVKKSLLNSEIQGLLNILPTPHFYYRKDVITTQEDVIDAVIKAFDCPVNENSNLIQDAFTYLAFKLLDMEGIKCVAVGLGGATPKSLRQYEPCFYITLPNYTGYSDSSYKGILAYDNLFFVISFLKANPQSKLSIEIMKKNNFNIKPLSLDLPIRNYYDYSSQACKFEKINQLAGDFCEFYPQLFKKPEDFIEYMNLFNQALKEGVGDEDTSQLLDKITKSELNLPIEIIQFLLEKIIKNKLEESSQQVTKNINISHYQMVLFFHLFEAIETKNEEELKFIASHFDIKACGEFLMSQSLALVTGTHALIEKCEDEMAQKLITFLNKECGIPYPDFQQVMLLVIKRLDNPWCQLLMDTRHDLAKDGLSEYQYVLNNSKPAAYILNHCDFELARDLYFIDQRGTKKKFEIPYEVHSWLVEQFTPRSKRKELIAEIQFLTGHDHKNVYDQQLVSIFQFLKEHYPEEMNKILTFKNEEGKLVVDILEEQHLDGVLEFLQQECKFSFPFKIKEPQIDINQGIGVFAKIFLYSWEKTQKNPLDLTLYDLEDFLQYNDTQNRIQNSHEHLKRFIDQVSEKFGEEVGRKLNLEFEKKYEKKLKKSMAKEFTLFSTHESNSSLAPSEKTRLNQSSSFSGAFFSSNASSSLDPSIDVLAICDLVDKCYFDLLMNFEKNENLEDENILETNIEIEKKVEEEIDDEEIEEINGVYLENVVDWLKVNDKQNVIENSSALMMFIKMLKEKCGREENFEILIELNELYSFNFNQLSKK